MTTFLIHVGIYALISYLMLLYLGFTSYDGKWDSLDVIAGIFWPITVIVILADFFVSTYSRIKDRRFVQMTISVSKKIFFVVKKTVYYILFPFMPYEIGKVIKRKLNGGKSS